MVQVDVSAVRWQQDSDGAWLCLRVQSPQVAMNACDEYQADKEHVAQIRRKGRSLDANAYCWVLLDKLAAHYNLPREAIYREEIKTIGGVSDVLCMVERAADDFIRRWTAQGIGWMAEQGRSKIPGCVNVTVWYGSSSYDTEANEPVDRPDCIGLRVRRNRASAAPEAGSDEAGMGARRWAVKRKTWRASGLGCSLLCAAMAPARMAAPNGGAGVIAARSST